MSGLPSDWPGHWHCHSLISGCCDVNNALPWMGQEGAKGDRCHFLLRAVSIISHFLSFFLSFTIQLESSTSTDTLSLSETWKWSTRSGALFDAYLNHYCSRFLIEMMMSSSQACKRGKRDLNENQQHQLINSANHGLAAIDPRSGVTHHFTLLVVFIQGETECCWPQTLFILFFFLKKKCQEPSFSIFGGPDYFRIVKCSFALN